MLVVLALAADSRFSPESSSNGNSGRARYCVVERVATSKQTVTSRAVREEKRTKTSLMADPPKGEDRVRVYLDVKYESIKFADGGWTPIAAG